MRKNALTGAVRHVEKLGELDQLNEIVRVFFAKLGDHFKSSKRLKKFEGRGDHTRELVEIEEVDEIEELGEVGDDHLEKV